MSFLPTDLIQFVLLRFLDFKDLANLSTTCVKWKSFISDVYARKLSAGVVSDDLIEESCCNVLEILEIWRVGQSRLSCGQKHAVMIAQNGKVFMWRENEKRCVLRGLPDRTPARTVSCGYTHTVILTGEGLVYVFGSNSKGELGLGDTQERAYPTQVALKEPVKIAEGGNEYSAFVTCKNKILVCGSIEIETKTAIHAGARLLTSPVETSIGMLENNEKICKMSAGGRHILILTGRNKLYSAGSQEEQQLGRIPTNAEPSHSFGLVHFSGSPNHAIVQISAGANHSLVLFGNGSVYSFGKSSSGELGLPKFGNAACPIMIPNLPPALTVAAGHQHSVILAAKDSKVFAFGMGALGQLGYRASFWSSSYPRNSPLPKAGRSVKYAGAGSGFSVLVSGDGADCFACGKSNLCGGAAYGENSGLIIPTFSRLPPL